MFCQIDEKIWQNIEIFCVTQFYADMDTYDVEILSSSHELSYVCHHLHVL
jgi:hypothetical protein